MISDQKPSPENSDTADNNCFEDDSMVIDCVRQYMHPSSSSKIDLLPFRRRIHIWPDGLEERLLKFNNDCTLL